MPEIEKMPNVLPDTTPTLPPVVDVLCGNPDCEERHKGFATKADAALAAQYLQAGLEKLLAECQVSTFCFSALILHPDGVHAIGGFEGPQESLADLLTSLKTALDVDHATGDN